MKKLFITLVLLFIIVYPPVTSKAAQDHTVKESVLNYLIVKNNVLKYQVVKKIEKLGKLIKN